MHLSRRAARSIIINGGYVPMNMGGFEAYDKNGGKWYPELLQVFSKYLGK